ncbi:MAG: hypothetical protein E7211_20690 [Clostridium lundense]|nr:hypothetical protein [Clostridium lundense]
MKIEIYIPDHEKEVINKALELKAKRRFSQEVVNLLKGNKGITKEEVIELIRQYSSDNTNKNTANESDILSSISSVLGDI